MDIGQVINLKHEDEKVVHVYPIIYVEKQM